MLNLESCEIFHANSENVSLDSQRNPEKSKCMFSTIIQLFLVCSYDTILTEASKDWLVLERINEVARTSLYCSKTQ